jgi:chromate reductase, NAD(P)H dehydrogenase (quinone)
MTSPRILVFSGSVRTGSFNARLAKLAARALAEAGATVTAISLRDYPLPIYDGDTEAAMGPPEHAVALQALFAAHQGIFIAAPEYNAGVSPLLKNTIDWISRVRDNGGQAAAFGRPVFALGSASPGGLGGYRGLITLRQSLALGLQAVVLPPMVTIASAAQAFTEDGALKDERPVLALAALASRLVGAAEKVDG